MAITEYTYTKTVNARVLTNEINADPTISPKTVDHVVAVDDALSVWMSDSLNPPEETALDAVVAAHTNPVDPSLNRTLASSGVPDDYAGADGDNCIDASAEKLYQKAAGAWDAGTDLGGGGGVEVDNQSADSQSQFNTSSGSYVDVTGMTLTTSNTKNLNYMIFFNTGVSHDGESEGLDVQIVVDGVAQAASVRSWESYDGSVLPTVPRIVSTMVMVDNLANAKVIKVQARSSSDTLNLYNRTLMIRGIG